MTSKYILVEGSSLLESPIEFAKSIGSHRHLILFYEEIEYARAIAFENLHAGIANQQHSFYVSAKGNKDFLENEFKETMYGPNWAFNYNFLKKMKWIHDLLHIEKTSNLTSDSK